MSENKPLALLDSHGSLLQCPHELFQPSKVFHHFQLRDRNLSGFITDIFISVLKMVKSLMVNHNK